MDRKIKKKKWPKVLWSFVTATVLISITLYAVFRITDSTLTIEAEKVKIETVEKGAFPGIYTCCRDGSAPKTPLSLMPLREAGSRRFSWKAGNMVHQGDAILRLSNTNLLLDIMNREAEFFEQSNNLRNTRLLLEQNRLRLNIDLADVDYSLQQAERKLKRDSALFEEKFISEQDYQTARDEYDYALKRKELTVESMEKDLSFRKEQIAQLEASLERMRANLDIVKRKQENLTLKSTDQRAPDVAQCANRTIQSPRREPGPYRRNERI